MLFETYPVPTVTWPGHRVRVVIARGPEVEEPDLELPPEPPEPPKPTEDEAAILRHLFDAGPDSIRKIAAALPMDRRRVGRGLHALRAQARVHLTDEGWQPL
jgi:hypothetical protein